MARSPVRLATLALLALAVLLVHLLISDAAAVPRSALRAPGRAPGGGARARSAAPGSFAVAAPSYLRVGFAPHACIAFRALAHPNGVTVFIDPGHGGPDPGAEGVSATGRGVDEASANLAVALSLLPVLRRAGYEVVLSRTADTSVVPVPVALTYNGLHLDEEARVACANAARADLLISVHMNGFSDPSVGGAETIYDPARPFSAANERLAVLLESDVVRAMAAAGFNVPDRGVVPDLHLGSTTPGAPAGVNHLFVLGPRYRGWNDHPSAMPGALVEPVFVTDPYEDGVVASRAGDRAIANGIASAVEAFALDVPRTPASRARSGAR